MLTPSTKTSIPKADKETPVSSGYALGDEGSPLGSCVISAFSCSYSLPFIQLTVDLFNIPFKCKELP